MKSNIIAFPVDKIEDTMGFGLNRALEQMIEHCSEIYDVNTVENTIQQMFYNIRLRQVIEERGPAPKVKIKKSQKAEIL